MVAAQDFSRFGVHGHRLLVDLLHSDEGHKLPRVAMPIEFTQQVDVAPFVEIPVVLHDDGTLGAVSRDFGVVDQFVGDQLSRLRLVRVPWWLSFSNIL